MLKFQIALAIILVGCTAFLSCGRAQQMLDPGNEEMDMETPMEMDMEAPMEMAMEMMAAHKSWDYKMLPAPPQEVTKPEESGGAHGMGSRTVYFNEIGAMANRAGVMSPAEYPVGTMIVKEVMDVTETFVMHVATMAKTDDPMYAAHNGWMYGVTQRDSAEDELMMPTQLSVEMAQGCHDCHAKASETVVTTTTTPTDSVFVSLDPVTTNGDSNGNGGDQ